MVKFTHTVLAFRRKRKCYKFQILSYNVKIRHDETGNYKQLRSCEQEKLSSPGLASAKKQALRAYT